MSKGIMTDDVLFAIADQIMHIDNTAAGENPELRIDIAKLFVLAGMKAADSSDFAASRSYATYALSLLPSDHWISHYDLSLRCSFRSASHGIYFFACALRFAYASLSLLCLAIFFGCISSVCSTHLLSIALILVQPG